MFGTKKLAKRSIVGTRVSATSPQDGRFYPGTVTEQVREQTIISSAAFIVRFDTGFTCQVESRNIVGQGFQSISSATLQQGQKIFLTVNGREVCGFVLRHDLATSEVTALANIPSGESIRTTRKLEEIRLLESRKSARLVDQADFSRHTETQQQHTTNDVSSTRRPVTSHVIDVPVLASDKSRRLYRQRSSSDDFFQAESCEDSDDEQMMDERSAAMVLTSLSVSPKSLHNFSHNTEHVKDSLVSTSVTSSGFYSDRDDHSPPLQSLSESAPACVGYTPVTAGSDDDSSTGSAPLIIDEENERTIFKCTWRGCKESCSSRNAIERHIRRAHFNRDSDVELTDSEEDFHYTEEDVGTRSINKMTKSFAAMKTSSVCDSYSGRHRYRHVSAESCVTNQASTDNSTDNSIDNSIDLHKANINNVARSLDSGSDIYGQCQQKISTQLSSVPLSSAIYNQGPTTSLPLVFDDGQIQRSLSWQIPSSFTGMSSVSQRAARLSMQERLYQHQAQSPKSSVAATSVKVAQQRRARSEVRKCRKVYGMERKDQWCTQCKWKKACSRFVE